MPKYSSKGKKGRSLFVQLLIVMFILLGVFYTFMPHSVHMRYAPDWLFGFNFSHAYHVGYGIFAFGYALFLFMMTRPKKK